MKLHDLSNESGVKFGTSGVRGLVKDLSHNLCFHFVSAFLKQIVKTSPSKEIIIGHDLRPSSPIISQLCISAIEYFNFTPVYVGPLPTPAIAYYALEKNIPAIVVTGSHIPFDRNGIKFYKNDGEISKQDESLMMEYVLTDIDYPSINPLPQIEHAAYENFMSRYISFFGLGTLAGMKIGIYEHSSVARDLLKDCLSKLGAGVISIDRQNKFVPIDTEAVPARLENKAKKWVDQYNLDALVSTDGDADRPLIADENGEFFRGDIVGMLTAKFLETDIIVTPITSNSGCEMSGWFKEVKRTKVGSPYVIDGMLSYQDSKLNIVGFEANGGVLLGNTVGKNISRLMTRDAILPILTLLATSKQKNKKLSEIRSSLPNRFTYSDRISNSTRSLYEKWIQELKLDPERVLKNKMIKKDEITSIDHIDGVRIGLKSGNIIHFRLSGNAPELRCYVETDQAQTSKILCKRALKIVSEQIKNWGLNNKC